MDEQEKPEVKNTPQSELTLNDLANLRSIVDVAVKRGTFNASEISGVGTVYDRLNNFLTSISEQQKQNETK